jgi:hypothetical protein
MSMVAPASLPLASASFRNSRGSTTASNAEPLASAISSGVVP